MNRRNFITLLGGAAAWPLSARAQQPQMPLVGFVNGGALNSQLARRDAFRKGLGEMGYIEGRNVTVDYTWLDGHYERLPELVRRRAAVITTPGSTPASLAAKAATTTIPLVFGVAEDPATLGLVASLARPGGNATGINFFASEVDAKRLGMMHELLPKARRIAAVVNPANPTTAEQAEKGLREAARALGLEILVFKASSPDEIDAAFAALARERPDAVFVAGDAFFTSHAAQFATLAARDRMPASYASRDMVEAGLLMSYGVDIAETFRLDGNYVGRILKGEKPADLPVQQSTKFEFVINLQTARALGLEVPPTLLAIADEVIE
jgi:putative ABC transport system substrate-binding protein